MTAGGAVPADQGERDKALRSPKNLAVTAGAGTGKTTLLVSKIVRKVLDEKVAVDRLLALTFTEKAANELKEKVRRKLREVGRDEGIEKAEIGTIHSFCAHVLRRYPIEAGLRPDFEVDDGEAFDRMFERAWPRFLDRELGPEARRPRLWQELLRKTDLPALQKLAEGLCSFGIPDPIEDGNAALLWFTESATRAAPDLREALAGKAPPPAKKPKGATPAWTSALKLAQDRALIDEGFIGKALGLFQDFARQFRRDYLARGFVSFEAMLSLVHELLRNPAFLDALDQLRSRYDYILVDEFQDTDPVQGEIIQKLAEGKNRKLVPGRLFIVGDPKQSIYSFRGADIVAYQGLVQRILDEGGERAVLSTNFRSHGEILDFVNGVFSKVIVENGKLQPPYEPIHPRAGAKPALPGPSIEALLLEAASADESREAEGEAIADWIAERKKFAFKDVAILFKALTDAETYLEALRSRDIPYVVQGEKYFYGTTEVVDFVNLLRSVADPNDRLATAAVLRSPYGALTDQELYDLRKSLDYRAAPGGAPIFAFLRRWHERAGETGVGSLIDEIFEEGWALEIAQAGYHGEQAVANLLKLHQKAADLEAKGGCTLREFLDYARRAVRERQEEGESPLADDSIDAVTVLSIHRSKGLEYPVVILPDLHRVPHASRDPVLRVNWPMKTLGVRLGEVVDASGAALAWLDRERRREEEKRLLYVAATRAREKLILLGSADARETTYLATLLPEIEARAKVTRRPYAPPAFRRASSAPGGERPDWAAFTSRWAERRARAEAAAPLVTSPSALEAERWLGAEAEPTRASDLGTSCHRVLERLDFRTPAVPEGTGAEAAGILKGFFKSAAFKELAGAEILAREWPFVVPRGAGVMQGVIDVLYRVRGKLVVADYKTDKLMQPQDYALIRDVYTDAVKRALGEAPLFKLIYVRHGKSVEL